MAHQRHTTAQGQCSSLLFNAFRFRFKEFELKLPDEVVEGALKLKGTEDDPVNLQIAVHHGQYEELFAMATIDFSDIKELVSVQG